MGRDFKEALRTVRRNPGLTVVVVLTLALAIGANTALFSVLYGVLLRPLGYPQPDELVMVWEANRAQGQQNVPTSTATWLDWRERTTSLEAVAIYGERGFVLAQDGRPSRVDALEVVPDLFRVLEVPPEVGRVFGPDDEEPGSEHQVILSHGAWTRRFGQDPAILEQDLLLDGEAYEVVGVMPEGFEFPAGDPGVEMWVPLTVSLEALMTRPHRMYEAVGRLRAGLGLAEARREMATVAERIAQENPETMNGWTVELIPLHQQLVGDLGPTLWVLFGAVTLVLLIGCANVSNVLLVRSVEGARMSAVRSAFGASAGQLFRRSLVESLTFTGLGAGAALLVALWGVRVLRAALPGNIPRAADVGLDLPALAFLLGAALFSGFLVGLVPAVRALRPGIAQLLQQGQWGPGQGRAAQLLARILMGAEVALCLILLVGAGLTWRSFARMTAVDLGFRTEGVLSVVVSLPESRYQDFEVQRDFYLRLMERVKELPGVQGAGGVSALPMSSLGQEFEVPFTVEGLESQSPGERPLADYRGVLAGYFDVMGIPTVRGRVFDPRDGMDGRAVAVVNQTLADRYFPGVDPVGRFVSMPMAGELEIVGVVGDVLHEGPTAQARPELFVPHAQLPLTEMHVVVRSSGNLSMTADLVRRELLAQDPLLPPTEVATVESLLEATMAQPRLYMTLLGGLALCAVVLAVVGVYGVVSYSVARRTGEMGLRMAFGSSPGGTLLLVVRQAGTVVVVGAAVGLVGAALLARGARALLFQVGALDPGTYALAALAAVAIGLSAAAVPGLRASRVDPAVALREE